MDTINDIAISVKGVYKDFKLPHEKSSGLKQHLVNTLKRKKGYEIQHTLRDVSFDIKRGEFFGIVGRNGSGKSTLLKLLADIYTPNKGTIEINGSLTPFIELGVGFNPELTGRENIYMNGALLGFSVKEVDLIYDDVVNFAELEKFMDQKLKNYSSGMQVRLAFSIAIQSKSDILLFDEVLAVGDASFQQKCYETFETLKENGKTIVLVTHDMSAVQRFCERAIMIDDGMVVLEGNPSSIADRYLEDNFGGSLTKVKNKLAKEHNYIVKNVHLTSNGIETNILSLKDDISVSFTIEAEDDIKPYGIGFQIFTSDGTYVFGTNTTNAGVERITGKLNTIKVDLSPTLLPGSYYITLAVMNQKTTKVLRYMPKQATFTIKQETKVQGISIMDNKWSVN